VPEPRISEVGIVKLKWSKSSGVDQIPAGLNQVGGGTLHSEVLSLLT
jgi:hypothetical protein